MKLSRKQLLTVFFVIAGMIIAFGWWAKNDADAKASAYQQVASASDKAYADKVDSLKLTSLVGVYTDGREDIKTMQEICRTATSLAEQVNKSTTLEKSLGSILSGTYRHAQTDVAQRQELNDKRSAALTSYAKQCDYYVYSSVIEVKRDDIYESEAMKSLMYSGGNCPVSTCIKNGQYQAWLAERQKAYDLHVDRQKYYEATACPFESEAGKGLCRELKQTFSEVVAHDEEYMAAVRAENKTKMNDMVRSNAAGLPFRGLNTRLKTIDPTVENANQLYIKLVKPLEDSLRGELKTAKTTS